MKFNSTVSIMPRRKHIVLAGIAVVLALTGTSPAFAGRQVHGADAARFLSGKGFRIECIDGTVGRGAVSTAGVANVSYRRPSDQREEHDNAVMRVKGAEICLAWK